MGKPPILIQDESGLKKGPWTPEEDEKLIDYIQKHGHGSWRALPKLAGLNRCGKSCRLRWTNYLRPDIKRGKFSEEEEQIIINFHQVLGNKWSAIAQHLPGRTDNEIKNFWNTHLKKRLLQMGIDPVTHRPRTDLINILANLPPLLAAANLSNLITNNAPWDNAIRAQLGDATTKLQCTLLHNILQVLTSTSPPPPNHVGLNIDQQDHQLYDHDQYLRIMNSQLQGVLLTGCQAGLSSQLGITIDHQLQSSFPNLEAPHDHHPRFNCYNILPMKDDPKSCTNNINYNHQLVSSNMVSASPADCSSSANKSTKPNPCNLITSSTFEGWGDLNMDDEANDTYWRDIIEQASSQAWPN